MKTVIFENIIQCKDVEKYFNFFSRTEIIYVDFYRSIELPADVVINVLDNLFALGLNIIPRFSTTQILNKPFLERVTSILALKEVNISFTLSPDRLFSHDSRVVFSSDKEPLLENLRELSGHFRHHKIKFSVDLEFSQDSTANIYSAIVFIEEYCMVERIILSPKGSPEADFTILVKNQLDLVSIYLKKFLYIYFNPLIPENYAWEVRTENIFRGPRILDIDLSNTCSHNCVFCGLYSSPDKTDPLDRKFIAQKKLDPKVFERIVETIPDKLEVVKLGGIGEPTSSPIFNHVIEKFLEKGLSISVMSHFSTITEKSLKLLISAAQHNNGKLELLINLSASTPDTYCKIRPNQSLETFQKVLGNIKEVTSNSMSDKLSIILVMIVNSLNYHEMEEFVVLAKSLGVRNVYLKPVEFHKTDDDLFISEKDRPRYIETLRRALVVGKKLGIKFSEQATMEAVCGRVPDADDLNLRIKEILLKNPMISYEALFSKTSISEKPIPPSFIVQHNSSDVNESLSIDGNQESLLVMNGSLPFNYYEKNSCNIAYEYLRIGCVGEFLPCCTSTYTLKGSSDGNIKNIWNSSALNNFRKITEKFPITKIFKSCSEWNFCQNCPHVLINHTFNSFRLDDNSLH